METIIFTVSKTRAAKAARKLRNFGVLSKYESGSLVVFVTKHGEETTRKIVHRALETPCQI